MSNPLKPAPSVHSDSLNAEYAKRTPPTPPAAPYGADGRGERGGRGPKSYGDDGRKTSIRGKDRD